MKTIFKESNSPTYRNNEKQIQLFKTFQKAKFQMPVTGQRHKKVMPGYKILSFSK